MIDEILNKIDLDILIKKYNSDYKLIIDTIDNHIEYLTDTIDNYSIQSKMIKDKLITNRETLKLYRIGVDRDRQMNSLDIKD